MEIYYKDFQKILVQLSDELGEFKSLYTKRITYGCLPRDEELRYQSLLYSTANLLNEVRDVNKIFFREKPCCESDRNSYSELKDSFLKSSYN